MSVNSQRSNRMVKEQDPAREPRKQLPSIPQSTQQEERSQSGSSPRPPLHGYGPFLLEYSIMAEYALLAKQKTPGCYVIPSSLTPLVWYGMVFVRQGLYQEGVFKFTMTIPETFPDSTCPTVVFDFPVFHPLIDPTTGELDVQRAFPKWRKSVNHLWQVLLYIRRIFYKIETKNPFNTEAATLYEKDLDLYKEKVKDMVALSKERVYDMPKSDDPHSIKVTPWVASVHGEAHKEMMEGKVKESESRRPLTPSEPRGFSWINPGSVQIFSKHPSK